MPALRTVGMLASPHLTALCLVAAFVVVLAGTLAMGGGDLHYAQTRFFKSFVVWWSPAHDLHLPVLPGAYTIGALLLANLVARQVTSFAVRGISVGALMIHSGVGLLLLGQLVADQMSERSALRLTRGLPANYAEDLLAQELVIADRDGPVVTVPESVLERKGEVHHQPSQLTIRVKEFWPNAGLSVRPVPGARRISVTRGTTRNTAYILPRPVVEDAETGNAPAAVIEVLTPSSSLGAWILSTRLRGTQRFAHQNREFEIALGARRRYRPFSITLLDARRDLHHGTDVARSIWSRVRIQNPASRDEREVVVAVNKPFRYQGETYYQSQVDAAGERSTLQVVRNPGWAMPYISCALVGFGLLVQLTAPLKGLARKGSL